MTEEYPTWVERAANIVRAHWSRRPAQTEVGTAGRIACVLTILLEVLPEPAGKSWRRVQQALGEENVPTKVASMLEIGNWIKKGENQNAV